MSSLGGAYIAIEKLLVTSHTYVPATLFRRIVLRVRSALREASRAVEGPAELALVDHYKRGYQLRSLGLALQQLLHSVEVVSHSSRGNSSSMLKIESPS